MPCNCIHNTCTFMIITGMFYYTIGNLRPELRSTLKATQLIACVSSSNIKKYGFRPILSPFINDVKLNTVCVTE